MDMSRVLGLVMGGGQGNRLYPLTRERSKPAVPLAGKYRLIDIPLSNCLHAGIDKIAILTQFNSVSLHRHIYSTYKRDVFSQGWIQILAAEQTLLSADWYQGTADAVRKQMIEIQEAGADTIVILAGDHLYRMDFGRFVDFHRQSGADVTVAVQPVSREAAPSLGILKLSEDGRITDFIEKPQTPEAAAGFERPDHPEEPYLASMGIYVFSLEAMRALLESEPGHDFGKHIIPAAIRDCRILGYVFDGYWEDIGTMRRYYEVSLRLAGDDPPFDFFLPGRLIYSRPRFLPGSTVKSSQLDGVLLADGCRIYDAVITNSVIGLRSIVGAGSTINRSVLMGADFYETEENLAQNERLGLPHVGIGEGSTIEGAIIDKDARIGRNVTISYIKDRADEVQGNWVAREGLIVVPKGAMIPDNTRI